MSTILPSKSHVLHRQVFELRYDFGYTYWDRCGRVVKEIVQSFPDFDFESIQTGHCHIRWNDQNVDLNIGFKKLDLSQVQNNDVEKLMPADEFARFAEDFVGVVMKVFELSEFGRIGYRTMNLYPTQGRDDADRLLGQLKHFQFTEQWGSVSSPSFAVEIDRKDKMVRVYLTSFEQTIRIPVALEKQIRVKAKGLPKGQRRARMEQMKAKHKTDAFPQYGVLLDLDSWIEEPSIGNGVAVGEFIVGATNEFGSLRDRVLESK